MNYLAHIYLSGENDEIRLGNFIGDSVKGNNYQKYPELIGKGIILHRGIDDFTDRHPVYRKSKNRFRDAYHKHAGIVADILYDHLLHKNWASYSTEGVDGFIRHIYVLAVLNLPMMPSRVKRFLPFMILRNWLGSYKTLEGIGSIYERMPRQTSLPAESDFAIKVIKQHYDEFNEEFNIFFKELIEFVEGQGIVIPYKT